jgi:hypothetical protein
MATELLGPLEISCFLSVPRSDSFSFVPKSSAHISAPATISAIIQANLNSTSRKKSASPFQKAESVLNSRQSHQPGRNLPLCRVCSSC